MAQYLVMLLSLVFVTIVTMEQAQAASKTMCDGQRAYLRCYQNKAIKIQSSFYGRQDNDICTSHPSHYIPRGGCSEPRALSIAKAKCDGKKICNIGTKEFGDPCYGTFKYLTVSWTCGDTYSETMCDGQRKNLVCDQNKAIKIQSSFYGRQTNDICTSHPSHYIPREGCSEPRALSIAKARCDGKKVCNIGTHEFGDPCFGTFKYLTVSWTCGDTYSETMCDGQRTNLVCDGNKVIEIQSSFYGRKRNDICTSHPHHYIPRGGCTEPKALTMAKGRCDGRQTCDIGTHEFGDPCYNTFKYLTVSWRCK